MRDDFTKFSTIYQWFQTLIHPLIQQHPKLKVPLPQSYKQDEKLVSE
ncbi:hypothetical protein RintRC_5258 [Richelia intracellularis]|nr:hypothetical protein RintRC_5258 [Richelia intracellularis]